MVKTAMQTVFFIFALDLASNWATSVQILAVEVIQRHGRFVGLPKKMPARTPLSFDRGIHQPSTECGRPAGSTPIVACVRIKEISGNTLSTAHNDSSTPTF